jgi:hypothetical protein
VNARRILLLTTLLLAWVEAQAASPPNATDDIAPRRVIPALVVPADIRH